MTKKHFNAIAQTISGQLETLPHIYPGDVEAQTVAKAAIYRVVLSLVNNFDQFNPQFDRQRFLAACGFWE